MLKSLKPKLEGTSLVDFHSMLKEEDVKHVLELE